MKRYLLITVCLLALTNVSYGQGATILKAFGKASVSTQLAKQSLKSSCISSFAVEASKAASMQDKKSYAPVSPKLTKNYPSIALPTISLDSTSTKDRIATFKKKLNNRQKISLTL